jgi:hypothetical protein
MILSDSPAGAGQFRSPMIARIRVEPLFQGVRRQAQSLSPGRQLDGFQIEIGERRVAYEGLDFLGDFVCEVRVKPFFSASRLEAAAEPSNSRSAQISQFSQ